MLLDWRQESITIVRVVVGVFRVLVLYYNLLEQLAYFNNQMSCPRFWSVGLVLCVFR